MDKETVLRFSKTGTGDVIGDIGRLKMTPVERVKDLLDRIEYEYKCDAGSFGTLTDSEAEHTYKLLLDAVPNTTGVTEKDIQYLTSLIQEKIRDISMFELTEIKAIFNDDKKLNEMVSSFADIEEISEEEARKRVLISLKERSDRHSKKLEDYNKKTPVIPGEGEPGDEGNR